MPSMANLTVKAYNTTSDVIYVAQTPSAGDKTPARWRVDAFGTVPANRPVFTVSSYASANGQARLVNGKLVYPETYTDSTTGLINVRNSASISFSAIIPQMLNMSTINETVAQFANLLKTALMQEVIASGYAPN